MEADGKMTFELPKDLIKKFRKTVKESGYTQKFLVSKIMREIVRELEEIKKAENESK